MPGYPDPYAPIEAVPLMTADGTPSRAFAICISDTAHPSGRREVGTVNRSSFVVPNAALRDAALEIARRSGHDFEIVRTLTDAAGSRLALVLASPTLALTEVAHSNPVVDSASIREREAVTAAMLFENDYAGSRRCHVRLIAYHMGTRTAMVVHPGTLGQHRFRHGPESAAWEDELHRASSLLDGAPAAMQTFAGAASKLAATRITAEHLRALRRGHLSELPLTIWGRTIDRTLAREAHTLWGLLCGGTHGLWHRSTSLRDLEHSERITSGLLRYASRLG